MGGIRNGGQAPKKIQLADKSRQSIDFTAEHWGFDLCEDTKRNTAGRTGFGRKDADWARGRGRFKSEKI